MRRWVCIVALLAGFRSDDYVRSVRSRIPIAIERPVESMGSTRLTRGPIVTASAWWGRP